jgi:thioesterase domain-containing protein/acyl carrier protein
MVTPAVMEGMKRLFPNAELFVIYGCTEVSCMGTSYAIDRETTLNRTLVGKPFPNVMLRIFDSKRNLVPFGVVGEICFAGEGIVQGYHDRPELTAERFAEIEGHRFYHTGDMGRLHPDGNLEILGRRDFQVQLRGIRIELAGIEKTVIELGLAAQCAVVAKTVGEGDLRLVAFLVNPRNDKIVTVRRALAMELPDYMLPHHIEILKAMPLTANGKLDRIRLKEMPWQTTIDTAGKTAPANEREQKIAEVFARVLGLREIGVEDNFFDLGGDSLVGALALAEIEQAIKVAIPPQILFESGTVRALANYRASVGADEPKPILLNREVPGVPLFMLSGVHIYRELARRLDGQCSAYGVFTRQELGVFDPASGFQSVEDLARDYLQIIRSQQPTGPYRLLGYSFSGLVAYEVAQQLRAAGEEVQCLALVDTHIDPWSAGWKYRFARTTDLRSAHLRHVASSLWRRLQKKRGPSHGKSVVYHDDKELELWDVQRGVANNNAAAQYVPRIRPAVGTVLLFTSTRRLRENPFYSLNCGWSRHIPALALHPIDADHFQMMRDDPYVLGIAEILAKQMRTEPAKIS